MQIVDNIREAVKSFTEKNSKVTLAIIVLLVFLGISAICLLVAQPRAKKRVQPPVPPAAELSADEAFMMPQEAPLTEDYYFSRLSSEKWAKDEADRWFYKPDEASLNALGRANDTIVEEILGAAP